MIKKKLHDRRLFDERGLYVEHGRVLSQRMGSFGLPCGKGPLKITKLATSGSHETFYSIFNSCTYILFA